MSPERWEEPLGSCEDHYSWGPPDPMAELQDRLCRFRSKIEMSCTFKFLTHAHYSIIVRCGDCPDEAECAGQVRSLHAEDQEISNDQTRCGLPGP